MITHLGGDDLDVSDVAASLHHTLHEGDSSLDVLVNQVRPVWKQTQS